MKPHVSGVLSKVRLDPDDLAAQIRAYYRARGWGDDGVPLPETLERLDIADYATA
jgi:aldehyde:ferredoxin oxidoreductase